MDWVLMGYVFADDYPAKVAEMLNFDWRKQLISVQNGLKKSNP